MIPCRPPRRRPVPDPMRARSALIGMVLCAIAVLPAAAAETVEVRAGEHAEGYARLAVEWPTPAAFEAKLDGDTLTIHFARPFTAQLASVSKKLKDYVSQIK